MSQHRQRVHVSPPKIHQFPNQRRYRAATTAIQPPNSKTVLTTSYQCISQGFRARSLALRTTSSSGNIPTKFNEGLRVAARPGPSTPRRVRALAEKEHADNIHRQGDGDILLSKICWA
ncbi:hypothetical protein CVT26_003616 [Gymnopilus dilepis]|uniref:Uncharacterized protein n=1 Tax=Gymnopilus dilepis TaxID=231916 RepID=A0A409WR93_9AGAR|nr:hypothetical protein CVT26_003616 [Gymnopilus dilepis]